MAHSDGSHRFAREVGERVRDLRRARGWSQSDLADALTRLGFPMHQTTLAKLERAQRPTPLEDLYALSQVFGVPVVGLLAKADLTDRPALEERLRDLVEERSFFAGRSDELERERLAMLSALAEIDAKIDALRLEIGGGDGQHQEAP
ncbi:helix-turn-helix domain-containing protein [Cellulomonas uda]|uniref:HTH cro/C1-type domain-containing protein n=1 Tax=Cellulomonas uda TaxID=1714 RepID=A0A4Y3KA87_CELUD|nr:helix-turn-helix transcriptional regulator [Cellulomonas uda]NII65574.1 transcriptional regulator with XRE-family HTH domain [Cellulomonas uda]GEA81391.1 hypothetical protein CUD01_18350 [Cellulomonas uda]